MYLSPPTLRSRSAWHTLAMHSLIIILYYAVLDSVIGVAFWYFDRLLWYPLLLTIQWSLLDSRPSLRHWLKWSGIAAPILWYAALRIAEPLEQYFIRDLFFPNTPMDERYIFISLLMANVLFGAILGTVQRVLLKQAGAPTTWWMPMIVLAYSVTSICWYASTRPN